MRDLSSTERTIVESVSRERLMADTEAIARWVRLSGTEEELASFDYVEDVLRRMEIETTRHTGWARAVYEGTLSEEFTKELNEIE